MPYSTIESKKLYTQTPVGFKRVNRTPLDVDSVMRNFSELKDYMNSGAYYVGQRIAVTLYSKGDYNTDNYVIMCVNGKNKLDVVSFTGGIKNNLELHFETINYNGVNYKCLMIAYRNCNEIQTPYNIYYDTANPNVFNIIGIAKYIYAFNGKDSIKVFKKNITNDTITNQTVSVISDDALTLGLYNLFELNSQIELYISVGDLFK